MTRGLFIIQGIGTSTSNCGISGERIRHRTTPIRRAFASLVPLHRRSRRADAKISRRLRRPQQMGHRPYDSILHRGIAGTSA